LLPFVGEKRASCFFDDSLTIITIVFYGQHSTKSVLRLSCFILSMVLFAMPAVQAIWNSADRKTGLALAKPVKCRRNTERMRRILILKRAVTFRRFFAVLLSGRF
jgi:hypothetical protein